MEWSGSVADIPIMWHLCNGNRGTPDLRDRFIVGAGSTYAPGATGGFTDHVHTGTTDGHSHGIFGTAIAQAPGAAAAANTTTDTDTFTADTANTLPPYYALAYIMYLKVKR